MRNIFIACLIILTKMCHAQGEPDTVMGKILIEMFHRRITIEDSYYERGPVGINLKSKTNDSSYSDTIYHIWDYKSDVSNFHFQNIILKGYKPKIHTNNLKKRLKNSKIDFRIIKLHSSCNKRDLTYYYIQAHFVIIYMGYNGFTQFKLFDHNECDVPVQYHLARNYAVIDILK